jgi:hypothetical protein
MMRSSLPSGCRTVIGIFRAGMAETRKDAVSSRSKEKNTILFIP